MMKINSLILGIGETGVRAVNRIKSDLPDFHTATLSDENSAKIFRERLNHERTMAMTIPSIHYAAVRTRN